MAGMILNLGEMASWGGRIGLDDLMLISAGGLITGLVGGLVGGLVFGLVEPRSLLITSHTPKEASSRSRIAALIWLGFGLVMGLVGWLSSTLFFVLFVVQEGLEPAVIVHELFFGLSIGMVFGLVFGLRNGGGFVLLQKVAHRRLAKAGNLPPRPADFLEWGIEQQIFRQVGGGVRFRHNLIQQHLANTSVDVTEITAASRSD